MIKTVKPIKFLLLLTYAFLVGFASFALQTKPAYAATGTWVNASTIRVGSDDYIDSDPFDTNLNFKLNGVQDSCASEILDFDTGDIFNTSELDEATLRIKVQDPLTGLCPSTDDTLTLNTQNARLFFSWVDQDNIESLANGSIWTRIPGQDVFAETTSSDCKDSLELNGQASVTLVQRGGDIVCAEQRRETNLAVSNVNNATLPGGTGTTAGGGGVGADDEPSCEGSGGAFGFIICPALNAFDEGIAWVDDRILNLLAVNEAYYDESANPGVKQAWAAIRNIAYVLLIPIMLVMVIGTALGFSFVDAYTVKRALPRLLAAIIFMALSFDIAEIMITVSNEVGKSVAGIIAAPFGGVDELQLNNIFRAPDASGNFLYGGVLAGVGLYLLSPVTVGFLGSLLGVTFIAMLVIFVLLVLREMLIIFLMILGPLAILSWIFPGNDKLWKLWWNSFSKLLLLFPIIAALLITGRVFAKIVDGTPTDENALIITVIKLVAFIGPYFFIPKAFQTAGSAFANIAGMAQNRERGFFDNQRKRRAAMYDQAKQKNKDFSRFSDNNILGRGANTMLGMSRNGRALTRGRGGVRAARQAGRANTGADMLKNDRIFQANQNDDNFLAALASEEFAEQKIREDRAAMEAALASGDMQTAMEKQRSIDARTKGLNAARQVQGRGTAAVRQNALTALAKTGYQFSAGEAGYQELDTIARSIAGNDNGAHAALMDESQYHLKNAGRFDLGGINHGAGYDIDTGLGKAGLYQLANGKSQSIDAWSQSIDHQFKEAQAGHIINKDGSAGRALNFDEIDSRRKAAAVQLSELKAMQPNVTGANLKSVNDQIQKLESDPTLEAYLRNNSGRIDPATGRQAEVFERYDPSRAAVDAAYATKFTPAEVAAGGRMRAETNRELAQAQARAYERVDPNKLD